MRVVAADSSHNFMQRTLSKHFVDVAPPETERERVDRELRDWLGKLERADKVGAQQSLLGELPQTSRAFPPLSALASVTNLYAERKGKPTTSTVRVERDLSNSSSRIKQAVVHFDIDLASSPTPSSPHPSSTSFFFSSRQAHSGTVAASSPPTSPNPVGTLTSSISQRLGKRSRDSCPLILPSALPSTLSTSAEVLSSPNKRTRRRYTLHSACSFSFLATFASRALATSNPALPNPHNNFAWSFGVSPTLGSSVPTPRQPFLDSENYFLNPLDVLWCAGWLPTDRSIAYDGPRRTGYIFVESGQADVERLQQKRGSLAQGKGPAMTVWIVEKSALESLGDWDKEGLLSVF